MKQNIKQILLLCLFSIIGCSPAPTETRPIDSNRGENSATNSSSAEESFTRSNNATAHSPDTMYEKENSAGHHKMPLFPMPPNATVEYPLDATLIKNPQGPTTYGFVDDRLRQSLEANGYEDTGYYAVPGGFAVTTAAEHFQNDGRPATTNRFVEKGGPPSIFSTEYWLGVLKGREERYRVIAFLITDQNYSGTQNTPSYETGKSLIYAGSRFLPAEMRSTAFTDQHKCLALVYEFRRDRSTKKVNFIRRSSVTPGQHLQSLLKTLKEK